MESVATFQSVPTVTSVVALPVMRVITHELRSPVQVTSSLLNVLSRGYVGELNDKQADLVDRARRRIQVLETLIDDLLDLAAGKANGPSDVPRGPVSLGEVLHMDGYASPSPIQALASRPMRYPGCFRSSFAPETPRLRENLGPAWA